MLNRIFVRENCDDEYSAVKSRFKIGVLGMGSGVGTSFAATAIAKELSKDKEKYVAYVEINMDKEKTFLYDSIGMDKRFAGRTFFDFYEEINQGRSIARLVNPDERINWAVCIPKQGQGAQAAGFQGKKSIDPMGACRLVNNITGDIVVCDITYSEAAEEVMRDMDVLVFVIDPLPSKLINNYDLLCKMKSRQLSGQNIWWIVNKCNDGVNKREFNEFVKIKQFIEIPMMPAKDIYGAEYNCSLPYSIKSIYEEMNKPIRQLIHMIIT